MSQALKRGSTVGQVNDTLTFRQSQQLLLDLPVMFKGIYQQLESLQKITQVQTTTMRQGLCDLSDVSEKDNKWLVNIHERLVSLQVEMRVSNIMMSEFLELQKSIVKEDVTLEAEHNRDELYDIVRNGG